MGRTAMLVRALAVGLLLAGPAARAADIESDLRALADEYLDAVLVLNQPVAYFSDLPLAQHNRF